LIPRGGIYVIIDLDHLPARTGGDVAQLARMAVDGGAVLLQLRAKGRDTDEIASVSREILDAVMHSGVPLIVNDDPFAAAESKAQGLHIGQEDLLHLPLEQARKIIGADRILGISSHDEQQAAAAARAGADYVAFGPVFSAGTKGVDDAPRGTEMLSAVCKSVDQPVVAIGGIDLSNVHMVSEAGAHMAAVITAVSNAPSPLEAVSELSRRFKAKS